MANPITGETPQERVKQLLDFEKKLFALGFQEYMPNKYVASWHNPRTKVCLDYDYNKGIFYAWFSDGIYTWEGNTMIFHGRKHK